MSDDLQRRVRSSVKIALGGTVASAVVQAGTMVLLARLLGPLDYGFFIVCLSINALSVSFLTSVIERAMVVEADAETLVGRAVPLVLLLLGVAAITVGTVAAVRLWTGWHVDLRVLVIILGAQVVGGLAIVPRALARRDVRFGQIISSELCALLFGNFLTAAILAWSGFGPFALAFGFAIQIAVTTIWMVSCYPRAICAMRFVHLGGLSETVFGVVKPAVLEAINGQISPLVVSAALGPVPLGLFNRLYNLVTLPVQLMVSSLSRVMISAFVAVAEDAERRLRVANMTLRAASALITPLSFGLAASGHAFVATVLGDKWLGAAPIVPFLAVAVWANMLGNLLSQLAEAGRRFNDKAKIQAISIVVLIVSLLLGSRGGLIGVAMGTMVAALVYLSLYLLLTASIVQVTRRTVFLWLVPGLVTGGTCYAVALGIGWAIAGSAQLIVLGGQIAGCGITTMTLLVALDRSLVLTLSDTMLPKRLGGLVRGGLRG